MTIASPITITINAVTYDCVKINQDGYGSHYRFADSTRRLDLKIRHSTNKPVNGVFNDRHNVELTHVVFSGDPDVADTETKASVVITNGATDLGTSAPYLTVALADFLKVSGNVGALVNWVN